MRVAKWGNSLAVRLPASVVEALGLQEGDEIERDGDRGAAFAPMIVDTHEKAVQFA